jgi:hypothetical protein
VSYATFRLNDQATFGHVVQVWQEPSPLLAVKALGEFQAGIVDRVDQGLSRRNLPRWAPIAYTSAAFAEVPALLGAGEIKAAPLVTHRFALEDKEQGYRALRSASGPRGKVMLDVNPETAETPGGVP